jgi:hypothetical protein
MSGESPRTPPWWRALPTWTQAVVLSLLLPGVVLHELTHILVAQPWGGGSIDWDTIACELEWRSDHPAPRAAAHIAPLVGGYALGVGALAVAIGQPGVTVHTGLLAYTSVNWLCYTVASVADAAVCVHYLREWHRQRTDRTMTHDTRS